MEIFNKIELEWKGETISINSDDQIFKLIGKIEEIATISEWQQYLSSGHISMSKLCAAYALVIQHAGVNVTEMEVYRVFVGAAYNQEVMQQAIAAIIMWCLPKDIVDQSIEEAQKEDRKQKKSVKPNSKKTSKRQKAKAL